MQKAKEAAKPKQDALEKAMRGVLPVDGYSNGNPIHDPGWRTPEQYERAKMTAVILADYERGMIPPADLLGAYSRDGQDVKFPDGQRVLVHDLIDAQRKKAYELLTQRVDPKAIATMLMRDEAWVLALRDEFNL